mmetsp:Transcript_72325/g.211924  ORF Transcript_72325/g.211924 Transcript_72325/m.211924 type:complete len:337 (-) Transcript_72325:84-1094(-)
MAGGLAQHLEAAKAHAAAGRKAEAQRSYEKACKRAQLSGCADPLERACALLSYASYVLQEEGTWPLVEDKGPDELLLSALEIARGAKQRSRALEGQLLFLRSKALFARPRRDAACLDAAMEARFEAAEVLRQASVEALQWPVKEVRSLLERLKETDGSGQLLSLEELPARLRREGLGGGAEVEQEVAALFSQWAVPTPDGEGLAVTAFLQNFLEIAETLDRLDVKAVDAEPCSAPCEGGLPEGSSALEKELVALISQHGAGAWEAKAKALQDKGLRGPEGDQLDAASVQSLWTALGPKLQKVVDADETMACGHSCSTCPTRHDCQVHTALRDIEDL